MIELGVDQNETNDGWTTVHTAAQYGNILVMDRLIELGVDLKEKSNDSWTSLHLAARKGHVAVVNRLHDLGIDLNT